MLHSETSKVVSKTNISTKTTSKYSIKALEKQQQSINSRIVEKDIATPFSIENLIIKWDEYIGLKEKNGEINLAAILKSNTPKLSEDYLISFTVPNEINKEELQIDLPNLLSFLKEKLNNYKIKIEIFRGTQIENKKKYIFTDDDKLKEFIKTNPKLSSLTKEFELEFES